MDFQCSDGIWLFCLMYKDLGFLEDFHVHLVFRTIFEQCDLILVNADTLCKHAHSSNSAALCSNWNFMLSLPRPLGSSKSDLGYLWYFKCFIWCDQAGRNCRCEVLRLLSLKVQEWHPRRQEYSGNTIIRSCSDLFLCTISITIDAELAAFVKCNMVKALPWRAIQAQRGCEVRLYSSLTSVLGRGGWSVPSPTPIPIVLGLGGLPWTAVENLPLPLPSLSLYQIHCTGCLCQM